MKPKNKSIYSYIPYIVLVFALLISCQVEESKPVYDGPIRVIELDPEPRDVPAFELNANREELLGYDCDLNWILFEYNSSKLSDMAISELNKVVRIIRENRNFKARIRAYTDSKGRPEYNQKLSMKRAQSAKEYLMTQGIAEDNISIDAYSEAKPIAKNTEDDSGRRYNRRIELFLLDKLNNTVCRSHPPEIPDGLKVDDQ